MQPADLAQLSARVRYSESFRAYKYLDTNGIPTLGWGLNLDRSDLGQIFAHAGVDLAEVNAAPCARTSDPADAVAPCITQAQADTIFDYLLPTYVSEASDLLAPGIFDAMVGPRQCAWADAAYNMGTGATGLGGFHNTIAILNQAQRLKNSGSLIAAHDAFVSAAQHLADSAWPGQVGNRALRDIAMIRVGEYCRIDGDGSDL